MSKTGQWVLEMQEDACHMTKEQFVETHGSAQIDIWKEVQSGVSDFEPEYNLGDTPCEKIFY